jgi:hypothetical protein
MPIVPSPETVAACGNMDKGLSPGTVAFVIASGVFNCFKITEGDWRNRNKWDAYERAVCNMVDRTSTEIAPWTLVEANDKSFARVKVLKTLCERIGKAL